MHINLLSFDFDIRSYSVSFYISSSCPGEGPRYPRDTPYFDFSKLLSKQFVLLKVELSPQLNFVSRYICEIIFFWNSFPVTLVIYSTTVSAEK